VLNNNNYIYRTDDLRKTGAIIKFLSVEPLLGPMLKMNLEGINWVIVGGESGPGARPLEKEWVTGVRDLCLKAKVPFFFKQWGGVQKKKAGRLLDGRTWDDMPREFNLVRV
jgi:protein gp37